MGTLIIIVRDTMFYCTYYRPEEYVPLADPHPERRGSADPGGGGPHQTDWNRRSPRTQGGECKYSTTLFIRTSLTRIVQLSAGHCFKFPYH